MGLGLPLLFSGQHIRLIASFLQHHVLKAHLEGKGRGQQWLQKTGLAKADPDTFPLERGKENDGLLGVHLHFLPDTRIPTINVGGIE